MTESKSVSMTTEAWQHGVVMREIRRFGVGVELRQIILSNLNIRARVCEKRVTIRRLPSVDRRRHSRVVGGLGCIIDIVIECVNVRLCGGVSQSLTANVSIRRACVRLPRVERR